MSQVDLCGKLVSDVSRFYQGDFPASPSVQPGSEEARKMTAISGLKCLESCRSSGPLGLLEKTLLVSSLWGSTLRLLTWNVRVTPAGRSLFRLSPSEPCTGGNGVSLLPTMTSADASGHKYHRDQKTGKKRLTPQGMVMPYLPTPTVPSSHCIGEMREWGGSGNRMRNPIPTPTANDAKNATPPPGAGKRDSIPGYPIRQGNSGKLNVLFVEWLMGFPEEWTACDVSGTRSSRNRHIQSSGRSRKSKGRGSECCGIPKPEVME